jgi:glutamyl-tRNA reductase
LTFDLDDLARVVAGSGRRRRSAVKRAGAIVREEAARCEAWRRARVAAPAIAALHGDAEKARRSVPSQHAGKLVRVGPAERALVETITSQLVAKLLHAPTLEMRRTASRLTPQQAPAASRDEAARERRVEEHVPARATVEVGASRARR